MYGALLHWVIGFHGLRDRYEALVYSQTRLTHFDFCEGSFVSLCQSDRCHQKGAGMACGETRFGHCFVQLIKNVRYLSGCRVSLAKLVLVLVSLVVFCHTATAGNGIFENAAIAPAMPDVSLAERLFPAVREIQRIEPQETDPAVWAAIGPAGRIGFIASIWEIAGRVGYSGLPIDILVGVSFDAKITGGEIIRYNAPVLALRICGEDIAKYVSGFSGHDLTIQKVEVDEYSNGLPSILAGATGSTDVIRDAVLRAVHAVGSLEPSDTPILVASSRQHSHRGTTYRKTGDTVAPRLGSHDRLVETFWRT